MYLIINSDRSQPNHKNEIESFPLVRFLIILGSGVYNTMDGVLELINLLVLLHRYTHESTPIRLQFYRFTTLEAEDTTAKTYIPNTLGVFTPLLSVVVAEMLGGKSGGCCTVRGHFYIHPYMYSVHVEVEGDMRYTRPLYR